MVRASLTRWIVHDPVARHRGVTFVILAVAGILMLAGAGKSVLSTYDNLAKADRLVAVSLIMSGLPENPLPVTFIDVDDDTRLAWNANGETPHDALAGLVRLAADKGSTAILLDFDLSADRRDSPADKALTDVLANYPATAPLLMLVRRITFIRAGGAAITSGDVSTPYDEAVKGKPNILWVSALNQAGADRSVRHVLLWQSVCDGASGVAFPSPALAVAARLRQGEAAAASLGEFLAARAASECGGSSAAAQAAWPKAADAKVVLPYVFADNTETRSLFRIRSGGKDTVVLRRISAGKLVSYNGPAPKVADAVDADPFEGRVVVIGASYTGSGDMHTTPLGTMPGSIVIANSLVQARTLTESEAASPWLRNVLSLILFLIFALLARKLVPVAALTLIFGLSLLSLFVLSRSLGFASAIDVVAVGLSGFAMFKFVDMIAQLLLLVPAKGWKVLLKN